MDRRVSVTDPCSHRDGEEIQNLGDVIIREAVAAELEALGWSADWIDYGRPTREPLLIGGANVIGAGAGFRRALWNPLRRAAANRPVLLFGVGWWKYQRGLDAVSAWAYRRVLRAGEHSVRDEYTRNHLAKAGIANALNTGCPTLWGLPDSMRFEGSDRVVFTLTDYARDAQADGALVARLLRRFRSVAFFPQGTGDPAYLDSLRAGLPGAGETIDVLPRTLEAFGHALQAGAHYVGTRLHAGIRALQLGAATTIFAVDNRATELARDTGLPVIPRHALEQLPDPAPSRRIELRLRRADIDRFRRALPASIAQLRGA